MSSKELDSRKKKMNNRNPVKQWAITFPQSGSVSRKEFADSFPPCENALCCMETHADGNPHLHLGLKLLKGLSKSKMLKWIASKWPEDFKRIDVQAVRSIGDWNNYISKEDPDIYRVDNGETKWKDPINTEAKLLAACRYIAEDNADRDRQERLANLRDDIWKEKREEDDAYTAWLIDNGYLPRSISDKQKMSLRHFDDNEVMTDPRYQELYEFLYIKD